jgi:acyl transferase domain-containing protein
MLAIRAGADTLQLPDGIELAAVNSPLLCTVSGPHEAIASYQKELDAKGIQCRLLNTSHAFHSAMMEPMVARFTEDAAMIPASAPRIPWISTCTGKPVDEATLADPAYWARQLRHTVHFSEALEAAFEDKDLVLLEVGPGKALAQFARQHPARGNAPVIAGLVRTLRRTGARPPPPSHLSFRTPEFLDRQLPIRGSSQSAGTTGSGTPATSLHSSPAHDFQYQSPR